MMGQFLFRNLAYLSQFSFGSLWNIKRASFFRLTKRNPQEAIFSIRAINSLKIVMDQSTTTLCHSKSATKKMSGIWTLKTYKHLD
jgi:hypothetical protein